jgi:hypothetical protein
MLCDRYIDKDIFDYDEEDKWYVAYILRVEEFPFSFSLKVINP